MKKRVQPLPPNQTYFFTMHPEKFDINKMEANEMQQADGSIIAKIPKDKDRIRIDENGIIKLVTGLEKDGETGEIREETMEIGRDISSILQGMMYATDVYHEYYDVFGNLYNDPMKKQEAAANKQADDKDNPEETTDSGSLPELQERLKVRVEEELKENNKVQVGGIELVRIPDIQGIRRLPPNQQGISNVQYVRDQWYDPVKKQSRNKKSIIGQVSDEYAEAMIPNENYYRLFNSQTGLPYGYQTPEEKERTDKFIEEIIENANEFNRRREEEKLRKEEDERNRKLYGENSPNLTKIAARRLDEMFSKWYDEDPDTCDDDSENEDGDASDADERDVSEKTNNKEEDEGKEDIQMLYDQINLEQERPAVLRVILKSITQSISNHAKKHPNDLINVYKARKINDILIEIRVRYQGSGYEDLLGMIQEPEEVEEDGQKYLTGMTYSDAEVLLTHYSAILEFIKPKKQ